MKTHLIVAIVLIVAGILALVYGQFTYTKDSETANIGPISFTVTDRETVNLPVWLGVGLIVAGAGVIAVPLIKQQ